ncbi:MAG: hypothetical protein U9R77_03720 [Pseudomonadota bacterium]|uniref:hypothetical protein n=1 Tax=Sphingobium naphthae TaxID=1886786 RepID=UPI002B0A8C30|nr:hypothetical protein [Pseudomonadota bacterium]
MIDDQISPPTPSPQDPAEGRPDIPPPNEGSPGTDSDAAGKPATNDPDEADGG